MFGRFTKMGDEERVVACPECGTKHRASYAAQEGVACISCDAPLKGITAKAEGIEKHAGRDDDQPAQPRVSQHSPATAGKPRDPVKEAQRDLRAGWVQVVAGLAAAPEGYEYREPRLRKIRAGR